jgi:hypothetical protein
MLPMDPVRTARIPWAQPEEDVPCRAATLYGRRAKHRSGPVARSLSSCCRRATTRCPRYTTVSAPVRSRMQSCGTRCHHQDPCGLSGFPAISRRHRTGNSRSRTPPPGKRVLIIGTGPSGLSATYHVARLGHAVGIKQAGPVPGGMMHFHIPAYRLPLSQSDEGDLPHRYRARTGPARTG